jgi:hypothetical protein
MIKVFRLLKTGKIVKIFFIVILYYGKEAHGIFR